MKKILSIVSVIIVGVDLMSKAWIENTLNLGASIQVIPDFFNLTYVQNTGAAWSLLSGGRMIFLIITPIILIGLLYAFFKEDKPLQCLSYALIFAGALGNFIDRLFLGYVRDMFSFNFFGYYFPVFNVADMAVVCGVFLMIMFIINEEVRLKKYGKN